MNEKRGFWYLLSGLVLGLAAGLLVAWVFAPVQFVDTTPASMRADFQDEYRFMIASAYAANHDLPRAQARLGTLSGSNPIKAIGEQAQRMLGNGANMEEVQVLADLNTALQAEPTTAPSSTAGISSTQFATPTNLPSAIPPTKTATASVSATPLSSPTPTLEDTPTPQPEPISTIASRPTLTITPTPGKPFKLTKQSNFCEPDQTGLLQIFLTNTAGKPAAGMELVITWFNGEEHFFTGLKPELGYGYADFSMTKDIEYALSLSAGETRLTGLNAPNCPITQGGTYPGGIRLEFKQP